MPRCLTGDLDQMRLRHDLLVAEGATCLMASLNSVGLVGMIELGRGTELPIHAHRNGWGALTRHPLLGWSYVAWQKIWRLTGADHMHVNAAFAQLAHQRRGFLWPEADARLHDVADQRPLVHPSQPAGALDAEARSGIGVGESLRQTDVLDAQPGELLQLEQVASHRCQ